MQFVMYYENVSIMYILQTNLTLKYINKLINHLFLNEYLTMI